MEATWKDHPRYVVAVERLRCRVPDELVGTEDQACFAWLWVEDDGSECPEMECKFRAVCKQAWQLAQVQSGQATSENEYVEAHKRSIDSRSRSRPLKKAPKGRDIYKDSDKYTRAGYKDLGRPVDRIVAAFVSGTGDQPHLAGTRRVARESSVRVGLIITASYHSLVVDGTVVARLWTNSVRHALLDIATELVAPVRSYYEEHPLGFKPPKRCPENSWLKVRPCTHRVKILTPAGGSVLAAIIKRKYRL